MKKFLTIEVPMWRALLALAVGVTYATTGTYMAGRKALELQADLLKK